MNNSIIKRILALAMTVAVVPAVPAGTLEMSGRVYAERTANLLPLGNGDGALTIEVSGVAAMSGEPPTLYAVNCAGLGLVDTDGKATTDIYCTFSENDANAFDLKGRVHEGEGKLDVIGGSGRFAGATGSGTFSRTGAAGDNSTGIIKVRISTR